MAEEERTDEDESEDSQAEDDGDSAESAETGKKQEGTQPGDWKRQPADKEDLRHDDSSEPLAKPLGDDADDDLAEQEAGDVAAGDEGFSRPDAPDEKEVGDTGRRLEKGAEPLLQGPEIAGVPTRSIIGIVAFIVVFLVVFFALWALLDTIGILLGILVGTALGVGAMKLLADRAS